MVDRAVAGRSLTIPALQRYQYMAVFVGRERCALAPSRRWASIITLFTGYRAFHFALDSDLYSWKLSPFLLADKQRIQNFRLCLQRQYNKGHSGMKSKFRCALARQGVALPASPRRYARASRRLAWAKRFGGAWSLAGQGVALRRSLAGGIVIALVLASGTPALARINKAKTIACDPYVGALAIEIGRAHV